MFLYELEAAEAERNAQEPQYRAMIALRPEYILPGVKETRMYDPGFDERDWQPDDPMSGRVNRRREVQLRLAVESNGR